MSSAYIQSLKDQVSRYAGTLRDVVLLAPVYGILMFHLMKDPRLAQHQREHFQDLEAAFAFYAGHSKRGGCVVDSSAIGRAPSSAAPEHAARQIDYRCDPQVDEGRAPRTPVHPHRRHAEALCGTQILEYVVDERAAVRVKVMGAHQHMKPL